MRTTLFIATLLLSCSLLGQDGWNRADKRAYDEADFAFYQGDLSFARETFGDLASRHVSYPPLDLRLGVCLLDIDQLPDTASTLIEKAMRAGESEAIYHLGRARHRQNRFDEAITLFTRYNQLEDKEMADEEVDRQIAICQVGKTRVANPVDIKITNIGPNVNSEHKEYIPVLPFSGEEMYFTSRRPSSTARLKDANGEYFEDIYRTKKTDEGWAAAENIGLPVNSETHDATVAISGDGNTMILYRTNDNLTGGDLYITTRRNDKWANPKKLGKQINSQHQEPSACLSEDGKMMIFSSNRPGGYGGKDLYRVKQLPNGEWSQPKNLGPVINSAYDEDAPFLGFDGHTLYFASTGHSTMGGYDLFMSTLVEAETWSVPENLGYPLNTVNDDIYLSVNPNAKKGYYSGVKSQGFGQLDIYEVEFTYRKNTEMVIKGDVMKPDGTPMSAKITLLDKNEREVQGVYNTNPRTGKFIMVINPLTLYKVFIEANGYRTQQDEIYFVFPDGDDIEFQIAPYILTK